MGGGPGVQPNTEKVRKGKPAGGVTTASLSMFTCQVSMVSQIAIPVFSARLRHRRRASKEPGSALVWGPRARSGARARARTESAFQFERERTLKQRAAKPCNETNRKIHSEPTCVLIG